MTVPTRTELHAEVDRLFRKEHPDAPEKLDPKDPSHAELIKAWLAIRDDTVNAWTNKVFFEHFPAAGKLDPNDPGDQQLIEYWLDIRNHIRDDAVPRWNWDGKAADDTSLRVRDIHNQGGARFVVDFESDASLEAATALIFPSGAPDSVSVSVFGPRQILVERVTGEALSSMPQWLANGFISASQGLDPVPESTPGVDVPSPAGSPHPEIDIDTPEKLESWLESKAHLAGEIGHVDELIETVAQATGTILRNSAVEAAGFDAAAGVGWGGAGVPQVMRYQKALRIAHLTHVFAKAISIVGDIALVVWVAYQVIEAFKGEKENQLRYGYLYGVMWEAMDEPDHIRTYSSPGITYSEQELRDAFVRGVAQGRAKGADLKVKNALKVWVASVAVGEGVGAWAAKTRVLTALYDKAFDTKSRFDQQWPKPRDYIGAAALFPPGDAARGGQ